MARRTLPHTHIRCLCGELCPLLWCACGNAQDGRCPWCRWWDRHEPHDHPAQRPTINESITAVVDMMNNGTGIDPDKVYPPGRYQGD